jgi:hypothetical protein
MLRSLLLKHENALDKNNVDNNVQEQKIIHTSKPNITTQTFKEV